ncbi:hypothetical protein Mesil_3632 (plasmid) [Allomeiothermus silvanus DSM 9946]|uniref:Uncharacterized protein n=1 Tax=Allomeiothermus silvanus (strain ATCC 700542 / DSM 9946 / NBRC 106475 / NCIMB 13440 / VI-R2) TaxID=526227 RepID=D7BJR6_ALLS1|nr:hypothetical protein [Allomeiothermus silvanus]ADH65422.1 hypothetical protein Mesil_3632 [Allomeiothermus silvanus DSM 9946]
MSNPVSQDYMKDALEQVRQALGGELPEPHTPAFEQALRRIQRERPDLLDILKSLQDPQALPPTNATHQANLREFAGAAKRARSVERTQNWLNRWFGIKDPRRDRVHFNYRLMALVIGSFVLAGGILWAVWPDLSRAMASHKRPSSVSYTSSTSSPDANSVPTPPPVASTPAPSGATPPSTATSAPPPPPLPTTTTPASQSPTPSAPASVPPPPSPPSSAGPSAPGERPYSGVVPPPPLPEYSATPAPAPGASPAAPAKPAFNPVKLQQAQQTASESGPVALKGEAASAQGKYAQLEREQAAKEPAYTAVLNPTSTKYTVFEGGKAEARNPVVLQGEQVQRSGYTPAIQSLSGPGGGYVALKTPQEQEKSAAAEPPTSAPTSSSDPLSPAPQASAALPAPTPAPTPASLSLSSPSVPTGQSPLSSPAPQAAASSPALAEYPFDVGEKQEGELVSGVVIPEGSSQAALMVRTKEGYVFFGVASLDRAGRLQMQFDRAYKGKTAYVVRAIALDERGVAGIPAQVSEQTPNLLTNLLRGAATGLVSYIDFYAKSSSTTILPGGGVASSNTPPPLGLTILSGSAKQIAAPPDSTSVVRVWSLDPGTKMQILIVPGEAAGAAGR